MACGIYAIVHTDTNDRYIGQSKDIHRRWRDHKRALETGSAHSTVLQEAWRAHGPDKFRFEILELCEPGDLDALEYAHMERGAQLNDTMPMIAVLDGEEILEAVLRGDRHELADKYAIDNIDELKRRCRLMVDVARHVEAIAECISNYIMDDDRLDNDNILRAMSDQIDESANYLGPSAEEIIIRLEQMG